MPTYMCRECGHVFVPNLEEVDFNSTSGFRPSESGYFALRNGMRDAPTSVKCPKCGAKNTEMATAL